MNELNEDIKVMGVIIEDARDRASWKRGSLLGQLLIKKEKKEDFF